MKILILYHSGVGNTKRVAKLIESNLKKHVEVECLSIEHLPKSMDYTVYSGLVIGFPTIHTHPTKRMIQFIEHLESHKKPLPVYIFTTYGLYTANTLRILGKACLKKNMLPVCSASYRAPATDGVLLAPQIRFFRKSSRNLSKKIRYDCDMFLTKVMTQDLTIHIPRFKLYSILNYPNKLAGHKITFPIYLHKAHCIKCGKCIKNCPGNALTIDTQQYPVFIKENCEKCYRCIHHCPKKALSLSLKKTPSITLNYSNFSLKDFD